MFKMFDIQTLFPICLLEKEKDMQSSKKTIHKAEIIKDDAHDTAISINKMLHIGHNIIC